MAAEHRPCYFLEVSAEIRLLIYDYVWDTYVSTRHDKSRPSLLRTCSLIYREAKPALIKSTRILIVPLVTPKIFYRKNRFGDRYVDVAAVRANELASPNRVLELVAEMPNLEYLIVWREWLAWFGPDRIDFWRLMVETTRRNMGSSLWNWTDWGSKYEDDIRWIYWQRYTNPFVED